LEEGRRLGSSIHSFIAYGSSDNKSICQNGLIDKETQERNSFQVELDGKSC